MLDYPVHFFFISVIYHPPPHILQFTATPSVENVVTEAQYSVRAESIALSGER